MNVDMNKLAEQVKKEYNVASEESPPQKEKVITKQPAVPEDTRGIRTVSLFSSEEFATTAVGLDYCSVMHELVKPIQKAIVRASTTSISQETLGRFINAFPVDSSWQVEELFETGRKFYVLKNQSREAQIYDMVKQACEKAEGDVVTLPAVTPVTLHIEEPGVNFKFDTYTLTFTRKELQYIKFAFIKEISVRFDDYSPDPFLGACYIIEFDRKNLGIAPFVSNHYD